MPIFQMRPVPHYALGLFILLKKGPDLWLFTDLLNKHFCTVNTVSGRSIQRKISALIYNYTHEITKLLCLGKLLELLQNAREIIS